MSQFCYVASPYGAVRQALELLEWRELAKKYVLKGAIAAKDMGFIPLSPVLLFWDVYSEESERREALEVGIRLLRRCECFLSVITPYNKDSKGMKQEEAIAKEMGLSIYEIL